VFRGGLFQLVAVGVADNFIANSPISGDAVFLLEVWPGYRSVDLAINGLLRFRVLQDHDSSRGCAASYGSQCRGEKDSFH